MKEEQESVALYIRVSTAEQAKEGFSLEAQKERLYSYCNYMRYKVFKLYCDAGLSGKETTKREEYNNMLKDLKKRKFTKVIAIKIDRISRNTVDFLTFFNTLQEYDCTLKILDIDVDFSTPIGKLLITVISAFAELERNMIVDRTLVGVEAAAKSGNFGGRPPLGYMKELVNGEKGKKWVINEEEAEIVKEIFDLCLKGNSYNDIANIIQEKYTDKYCYTKKNNETGEIETIPRTWTDASICTILNNKSYYGIREHRKKSKGKIIEIKDKIPAIITEDIFYECQDNIEKNKRNYYRNKKYLFMQKLVCPKCGRIMACNGTKKKTGQEYLYYKCKDCKEAFREDLVEKAVISKLRSFLEIYLAIESNYVAVDSDTAEELKKGKIDNSIRYAMDTITINKILNKGTYTNIDYLDQIWYSTDYETKHKFIREYIDTIEVKLHRNKSKKNVEILNLKLRPHKAKNLQNLFESNELDFLYGGYHNNEYSIVEFTEKQAEDYINILKKKYNINVIDVFKENKYYYNENLFKIINVDSNRAVERDTILYLEVLQ